MFYTIVSRILKTDNYLHIFIIGSILYVMIHWYLHMEKTRLGLLLVCQKYMYHLMVADFSVACILLKLFPFKKNVKDDLDEDVDVDVDVDADIDNNKILNQMQEARKEFLKNNKEGSIFSKSDDTSSKKVVKKNNDIVDTDIPVYSVENKKDS